MRPPLKLWGVPACMSSAEGFLSDSLPGLPQNRTSRWCFDRYQQRPHYIPLPLARENQLSDPASVPAKSGLPRANRSWWLSANIGDYRADHLSQTCQSVFSCHQPVRAKCIAYKLAPMTCYLPGHHKVLKLDSGYTRCIALLQLSSFLITPRLDVFLRYCLA